MITPEREKELMKLWVTLPPPWDDEYKAWLQSLPDEERSLIEKLDEEVEDYVQSEF